MAVRVVVGTQWGDEGKGKYIDDLRKILDNKVEIQVIPHD
jgi:adenylosuccinate synthase